MAREVVDPEGVTWEVGRQWVPRRLRIGRPDWRDIGEPGGLDGWDEPAGLVGALAVVAFAMVVFLVIFPVVAIALEVVLLLILLLAAVVGRVVLRRPWTVRAAGANGWRVRSWKVVGWRASGALVDEVAAALERGHELPSGSEALDDPVVA